MGNLTERGFTAIEVLLAMLFLVLIFTLAITFYQSSLISIQYSHHLAAASSLGSEALEKFLGRMGNYSLEPSRKEICDGIKYSILNEVTELPIEKDSTKLIVAEVSILWEDRAGKHRLVFKTARAQDSP